MIASNFTMAHHRPQIINLMANQRSSWIANPMRMGYMCGGEGGGLILTCPEGDYDSVEIPHFMMYTVKLRNKEIEGSINSCGILYVHCWRFSL